MSDIQTRTIREQRIKIGAEMAWVRREGNSIVIDYDYAGRATRETERFYADDIERLAQFVKDTNP